jgi:hypothetical protein
MRNASYQGLMPELSLYLNNSDGNLIVRWVLDAGGYLVPGKDYEQRSYLKVRTMEEFETLRAETSSFYALHSSFSKMPLEMVQNERTCKYFIMPRNGGPAIGLQLGGEVRRDGAQYVKPGSVNYYRTYWNFEEGRNDTAPKEQAAFYRDIAQKVKASFRCVRSKRLYWIGPGALHQVLRGARLVGLEHVVFP